MKHVKVPCTRDCPWRSWYCHGICPKYLKYDTYRQYVRQEKAKERTVNYDIYSIRKDGINNRHKNSKEGVQR